MGENRVRSVKATARLSLPALRQLSSNQYHRFKADLDALIRANNRISISEWSLRKFLIGSLAPEFEDRSPLSGNRTLKQMQDDCGLLLSMLAYSDRQFGTTREVAFAAGRDSLGLPVELVGREAISLSALERAVDALRTLSPLRKPKLLKACVATIIADGHVSPVEQQLIRSVAIMLDCPMPPIPEA